MGKPSGFLDYQRKNFTYTKIAERLTTFREFVFTQPENEMRLQGGRCMDCGIPYCHALGCPVYNLIPEWNDLVWRGRWREAYERLELTNNLPEITGRVCPAPCETSCTLSVNTAPVAIKEIELAIIEKAFASGWVVPRPPAVETGKRVAVIGSGPTGLAAAQELRRAGHQVTVFESGLKPGGILRYGIPDFKLEKQVLDRRLDQMSREGVQFETGVDVGEDVSARYVRKKYDAVLLALGAGEPRDLAVPGRGLEGIHFAMDYLTLQNRFLNGECSEHDLVSAKGKTVLVIGGGDTGADCVGTANRQGAKIVHQFEILPRPALWEKEYNPEWPDWPQILRTGSSHEEGVERDWSINTRQFAGRDVRVEQGLFVRVEWKKDERGRFAMTEIPGSEFTLPVDLVLLAMGFLHPRHSRLLEGLQTALDERGNVKTGPGYATSVPGVFAAGDAATGASLVVRAIWHGREAAKDVDRWLRGS
ncbi:MAG: glutamate synthase subunit beta [Spirochaetales bacterium]|nr:glutamate synthase subunit beta [Spirochaetales bacterium]